VSLHRPLRLRADWILPVTTPPIRDGAVLVDTAGRLTDVGADAIVPSPPGADRIDLGCAALLPGLVNVHGHADMAPFRGFLEDLSFAEWIRTLVRTRRALPDLDLTAAALWTCAEALSAGVTTMAVTEPSDAALDALRTAGMRGRIYREVFGPAPEDAADAMAALRRHVVALRERADELVGVGVSPHAPFTISDRLYREVAAFARSEALPVAVHIAESADEVRLVARGQGDFADALRQRGIEVEPRGSGPIQLLQRLGVLDTAPLLIHCVHLQDDDVARIRDAGASVAHCPVANARLGHGTAPLERLLAADVVVGLGTDSVASNNRLDLLGETHAAQVLHRARLRDPTFLPTARLLRLATLDGARALHLHERIGSLEPGKDADLCAVRLDGAHVAPVHDPVAAVFLAARGSDVTFTAVRGRVLFRDGKWTTLDVPTLRRRIEEDAARLHTTSPAGPAWPDTVAQPRPAGNTS
jgi:cytosine/adenosine deaminase-related metal-dependent hydrolase